MTRDNLERLEMFDYKEGNVEVIRIALNMEQVEQYNPPPNPAKVNDSRFKRYVIKYGSESWELDALEPQVIVALITKHVLKYRDDDLYNQRVAVENEARKALKRIAENWEF